MSEAGLLQASVGGAQREGKLEKVEEDFRGVKSSRQDSAR